MPLCSRTMVIHYPLTFFTSLLLLLPLAVATSSSLVGVNYGLLGDNLLSPDKVAPLLHSINVGRIRLYGAEPNIFRAFSNTGVELIVGLPDRCIPKVCDPNEALTWIRSNIQPYVPSTKVVAITVGNEVLTSNNTLIYQSLLPAMESLHSALVTLGLDHQIYVTTPHSVAILASSYPPSSGAFRPDLIPLLCPIFDFLSRTNSPLLINAYPYFAYKSDPGNISLDYVLFEPNPGVVDPKTGLKYENMLHAQVDAMYAAISAVKGPKRLEVRVSETGWPSAGDEDEPGATQANAAKYNGNLMKLVGEEKGTPMRLGTPLRVYVFALFNENLKPGPASERNYGLFNLLSCSGSASVSRRRLEPLLTWVVRLYPKEVGFYPSNDCLVAVFPTVQRSTSMWKQFRPPGLLPAAVLHLHRPRKTLSLLISFFQYPPQPSPSSTLS